MQTVNDNAGRNFSPRRRMLLRSGAWVATAIAGGTLVGCGGADDGTNPANAAVPPAVEPSSYVDPRTDEVFADATTIALEFPQNFAFTGHQIYVTILGSDPASGAFGYVDPRTATFQTGGTRDTFRLDAASMAFPLSALRRSGLRTWLLGVPKLASGRVYIAFGQNFDAMPDFGAGGPPNGPQNQVIYEKFELDTATNPNANVTNVDFFSVPYVLTAIDRNIGTPRSLGIGTTRQTVFDAFAAIPQLYSEIGGDSRAFEATKIVDAAGRVVRWLAPKAAGLSDWQGTAIEEKFANAQRFTHFWDRYINEHCWRPNREFRCYSKDGNGPIYYGRVDPDGTQLGLYTDPQRSNPYAVPSLPRPSCQPGSPDYLPGRGDPSLYHNCDSPRGAIDWGFLLGGNAGGQGDGAHWNSDPVAMSIMVAICRGVMHLDDGCTGWTDHSLFYRGNGNGVSTPDMPIFWYGQILHALSRNGAAYALSYDDIYGADPSIYFDRTARVDVKFMPF